MKNKWEIKFLSKPVMVIGLFCGVAFMIIKIAIIDHLDGEIFKVLGEIIGVLSDTLISITALNFFVSISTERELIKNIQTQINTNTDYDSMSLLALQQINKKISLAALSYNSRMLSLNGPDFKEMGEALSNDYWMMLSDNTYIEEYKRIVKIELTDTCINVRTLTCITYNNLVNREGQTYDFMYVFNNKTQAETFDIYELEHNKTNELINYKKYVNDSAPYIIEKNGRYMTKSPWKLPVDTAGQHEIKYSTKYSTNYADFFQVATLVHTCKAFHLSADINDSRTNSKVKYKLQCEIICPPSHQRRLALSFLPENNDTHFETMKKIPWLPRGSGYVLTINPYVS